MRRKFVAGNWKMNGNRASLAELDPIAAAASRCGAVDVAIFPAFTLIEPASQRQPGLLIGAQDCSDHDGGPYTGQVSAAMVREAGGRIVIVGHSERREYQRERDAAVRGKAKQAIAQNMVAITCIGETEAERDAGEAESIVTGQIWGSVTKYAQPETVIVSYEPVWAIGTGNTPTLDQIAGMHALIRETLCRKLGEAIGQGIRILYGGSVKPANAAAIMQVPDVDGALVGGASLKAADFVPIIEAAAAAG